MTRSGRASLCFALVVAAGLAAATPGATEHESPGARRAVTRVELVPATAGDTLTSVTPTFILRAVDVQPEDRLVLLGLQIALTPGFTAPQLVDSTIVGDTAVLTLRRPLPGGTRVYVRATARTAIGEIFVSPTIERVVPPWLTLLSPNAPNGVTLETQRPRFVWRSPRIEGVAAPWVYDLEIRNVASGQSLVYANLSDTVFTPTTPLELNTSYRWSVTARHRGGEGVTVQSQSSFVIVNSAIPSTTLLYQNFPNPFPTPTSSATCVWFDLHVAARVHLDIFDLSGRHVTTIIPGPLGASEFPAGRHGRVSGGPSGAGCNGNLQWDGRGDDGRFVPAGVYLLRFRAAGVESVKKIVFRGRP